MTRAIPAVSVRKGRTGMHGLIRRFAMAAGASALVLGSAAGAVISTGTAAQAAATQPPEPTSVFFACDDGQSYSYVVPTNVTTLSILAWGATGQAVPGSSIGGRGASVSATVPVSPGQTLSVKPGCPGSNVGAPGFSQGGNGGQPKGSGPSPGGEGGGSSGVSVNGGAVLTVGIAPNPLGAAWGPGDTIVFQPQFPGPLYQIPASGGEPRKRLDHLGGVDERYRQLHEFVRHTVDRSAPPRHAIGAANLSVQRV